MNSPPLRLRYAVAVDLPLLAQLNRQLIEDEHHRNPMTLAELQQRMQQWLSPQGGYTAILFQQPAEPTATAARRRTTPLPPTFGYCLYATQDPRPGFGPAPEVYVRHFFIAREHRRQKIGREAFRLLIDQIWPRGARIVLDVLAGNSAAREFWSALGFSEYALTLHREPPA